MEISEHFEGVEQIPKVADSTHLILYEFLEFLEQPRTATNSEARLGRLPNSREFCLENKRSTGHYSDSVEFWRGGGDRLPVPGVDGSEVPGVLIQRRSQEKGRLSSRRSLTRARC